MTCAVARALCVASIVGTAVLAGPPSLAQIPQRPAGTRPIEAGPMMLYPLFDSEIEYTDNLFFQPSESDSSSPQNDITPTSATVTSIIPGILAVLPKLRSELEFAYALRYRDYSGSDTPPSNLSHFAKVDGYFRFGPGLFATFEEVFESGVLDTEAFDPGGEITFRADEFTLNSLEATFGHERGQTSRLGVSVGVSKLDFDKRAQLPGFFDTDTNFALVFGERRAGSTLWLTWQLTAAEEDLSRPFQFGPGDPIFQDDRERDQTRVGAGVRWTRRPGSRLEVDLAYSRDEFKAVGPFPAEDLFRGIVGTVRYSNAVPSRIRLGLVLSRDVFPSVFRTNQYYESNRATGRIDAPVGARIRVGAAVSYWDNDYPEKYAPDPLAPEVQLRRKDTTLEERIYLGYLFGGRVEARVYWIDSSRSSVESDFEYDARRFGVTVRLGG